MTKDKGIMLVLGGYGVFGTMISSAAVGKRSAPICALPSAACTARCGPPVLTIDELEPGLAETGLTVTGEPVGGCGTGPPGELGRRTRVR